ncbi:MAG: ABC transporter permease subunit [Candidatus Sungbacteria bacterium]|nr:ABC transporter permease subunit [Candidatus Sungbacteria bacterium]
MHHPTKRKQLVIYQKRRHMVATLVVLVAPFLFLLVFSRLGHIATGTLFFDVFVSCVRLLIAYVIAAVLAWICAAAFYRGKRSVVALPVFDVLQSFPTFAALPVATLLWGVSEATVIALLIFTVIWPIFFSILSSLKLMKRDWEEAVEIAGWRGTEYLKRFLWPVSAPGLVTGSIIGLGEGWEALVATEIIVHTPSGLGSFFQTFSNNATITSFGILGLLILIFSANKLIWLPLLAWSHELTEE